MLAMWGPGILKVHERMQNEPALESSGQDESSSAGGVIMAVEEDDNFAHLFADSSIYMPSPAVIVAPVPVPVSLAGAEAPLSFTGPKKLLCRRFRDVQRPLIRSTKRRPPGRRLQHGKIGPVGRRGMLALQDRAPPTASSAAAAQQAGDAPHKLTKAQRRKKRRREMLTKFARREKRPRQ